MDGDAGELADMVGCARRGPSGPMVLATRCDSTQVGSGVGLETMMQTDMRMQVQVQVQVRVRASPFLTCPNLFTNSVVGCYTIRTSTLNVKFSVLL